MYDPFESMPRTAGGSRISSELRRLAAHYGFAVADNVVLTHGLTSVAIDHVVMDRYGLLIIDSEPHEGAYIVGTDTDSKWVAMHSNGQAIEFRNPLLLNAGNENLVKQLLAGYGIQLDPTEVRSAVVFVGADISRLSLVEVNSLKVRVVEALVDIFEARYGFPPNSGRLTGADMDRITSTVMSFSQVLPLEDEADTRWQPGPVVPTSVSTIGVPPPPTRAEGSYRASGQLAGHHGGTTEGPTVRAALLTVGTILVIILTLMAGWVFFPQLQAGSTTAWTVAVVLLVALAELVAANIASAPRNAGVPRKGGVVGGAVRFVGRVLAVFVFVALMWVLVAGGQAEKLGETIAAKLEGRWPKTTQPVAAPVRPGMAIAKKRLKEQAPEVYKSATDLNSPSIVPGRGGTTSYTWSYTPKGASAPASFTLTIDIDGNVVP